MPLSYKKCICIRIFGSLSRSQSIRIVYKICNIKVNSTHLTPRRRVLILVAPKPCGPSLYWLCSFSCGKCDVLYRKLGVPWWETKAELCGNRLKSKDEDIFVWFGLKRHWLKRDEIWSSFTLHSYFLMQGSVHIYTKKYTRQLYIHTFF